MRGAWLALAGAAGCASTAPPPCRDLEVARSELARLASGALDGEARDAWAEAEEALAAAELAAGTVDASDTSYVAKRMAERARLAALHEAARRALEHARGEVRRLAEDDERRAAFFAEVARRRKAEAEARTLASSVRRRALAEVRAGDPDGEIVEGPEGLAYRMSAEALFLPGTSLLRDGAEARLAAVAAALLRPPECDVRVQVIDDVDEPRTDAATLAARRRHRIHDVLVASGVARAAFVPELRRSPRGTQVDVLAIERPPVQP